MREQVEEAVRPSRPQVAFEDDFAFAFFVGVAAHAMPVEDWLDVAREIHHVGKTREGRMHSADGAALEVRVIAILRRSRAVFGQPTQPKTSQA